LATLALALTINAFGLVWVKLSSVI